MPSGQTRSATYNNSRAAQGSPAVVVCRYARAFLGVAFFLENNERAVLAHGCAGEGFAKAGDGRAALVGDAVFKALHQSFHVFARYGHVDFAPFRLAGIVAAAACEVQVRLLGVQRVDIAGADG